MNRESLFYRVSVKSKEYIFLNEYGWSIMSRMFLSQSGSDGLSSNSDFTVLVEWACTEMSVKFVCSESLKMCVVPSYIIF